MIDPATIRTDFPILQQQVYGHRLIYLDNAATTQKPQCVLDRLTDFYRQTNSNIHRGVHYLSAAASAAYEQARDKVREFINARRSREIIFTHGTTEAINLVAAAFGQAFINPGDEIIITEMEHHSNIVPWQILCDRQAAVLKVIPLTDEGHLDLKSLPSLITKNTKLIAVMYVSNVLGTINPIKNIIALAHDHDIPVLIDGAQAVQHLPVDVQDLDCDFFAFSGHKMYAATGIGVLYAKENWLEVMPPYQGGGGMIESVRLDGTTYADLPLKFEAGTPNIAAAISLEAAIQYLQDLGIEALAAYEQDLLDCLLTQLSNVKGVTIYSPQDQRCGVLSFNLDGVNPYDAGMILDKMGIAVRTGTHCAAPVMQHYGIKGTIRASLAIYNTREEMAQLITGLQKAKQLLSP